MLTLLKLLMAGFIGVGLGLTATEFSLQYQFSPERLNLGAWSTLPKIGTPEIDPYARARIAWSGEVPLGQGEGWTLTMRQDSQKQPLQAKCSYRLAGTIPASRFWTLTLAKPNGKLIENQTDRSSLTSGQVIYDADGNAPILMSQQVQPGNWLQLPATGAFMLSLQLYDSSFSALAGGMIEESQLPTLTRVACS